MTRLELSIAWRYMRGRRGSRLMSLISTIAVGGVIVGVSALIVILGVMNGLQHDLREKILTASPDVYVVPYGSDMVMYDWRTMLDRVREQEGVVAAAPFVSTQGIIQRVDGRYRETFFLMGITPDTGSAAVTRIRGTAVAGDFSFATPDGERRGVIMGSRMAERFYITPGLDSVRLLTGNLNELDPITGMPRGGATPLLVTGIFETGMYEYDDKFVFVALPVAQQLAQLDTSVNGIEVRTRSREAAPAVAVALRDTLGLTVATKDWAQQNSSLFSALRLEKLGMTFILLLIFLVAAFNIVGTLTMVVSDKTREIGILRAMGLPAASIRRIFLTQGIIIGAAGTLAGLALGLAASIAVGKYKLIPLDPKVYFIDHLPVRTEWLDVGLIVLGSLLIATIATIYPARQAARLLPVEAIRHE